MSARLREALDRTLLLMRDDLRAEVDDSALIAALTGTEVVLVADSRNLTSHSAQCAFITAALLMARSGHRVHLAAPDIPLVGTQPPLRGQKLVSALLETGGDLLPGIGFSAYAPRGDAALCVCFGDSAPRFRAQRTLAVNATAWSARLGATLDSKRWVDGDWPLGALAAGALVSVEAFKAAMLRLRSFAKDEALFETLFAITDNAHLHLAPDDAARTADLGRFDFVSGGAITNAALYVLARLPGVEGFGRIIEPESSDLSNLNRYALLRRSVIGEHKGDMLRSLMPPALDLQVIPKRYEGEHLPELGGFAPSVLVGVDDIPSRWNIQRQSPCWLGIGATTHWAAMASYHEESLACARCLHPRDDPTAGPIPTIAFVSFFAGLTLACYFARMRSGEPSPSSEQYTYFAPIRPERFLRFPVAARTECPICSPDAGARAA
jgi:hypothetical protein